MSEEFHVDPAPVPTSTNTPTPTACVDGFEQTSVPVVQVSLQGIDPECLKSYDWVSYPLQHSRSVSYDCWKNGVKKTCQRTVWDTYGQSWGALGLKSAPSHLWFEGKFVLTLPPGVRRIVGELRSTRGYAYVVSAPTAVPGQGASQPVPPGVFQIELSRTEDVVSQKGPTYAQIFHGHYWKYDYTYIALVAVDQVEMTVETQCGLRTLKFSVQSEGAYDLTYVYHQTVPSPISLVMAGEPDYLSATRVSFKLSEHQEGDSVMWFGSDVTPLLVTGVKEHKVVDGRNLFGTWTDGKSWNDGYEALASRDMNRDGVIRGDELADIKLWFDSNRDGVSDPGEIQDLLSHEISSLSTKATREVNHEIFGVRQIINDQGYTTVLGQLGASVDWFVPTGDMAEAWQHIVDSTRQKNSGLLYLRDAGAEEDPLNTAPVDY